MATCSGPLPEGLGCLFAHEPPPEHLTTATRLYSTSAIRMLLMLVGACGLPVCRQPGEAGSMTAVPSSVIRSRRARLGCTGEKEGERTPLSRPLARRGSLRSRGSSRDSMTTSRLHKHRARLSHVGGQCRTCTREMLDSKYLAYHNPTGYDPLPYNGKPTAGVKRNTD